MVSSIMTTYNISCRLCPRLANFLDTVKAKEPTYFAKPVPPFGDVHPKLLIVGLAPGMHGANRTGRPFTGDYAGGLLYSTLHKFGFSTSPQPLNEDGWANPDLKLVNCRITNAVKCLPPENKPEGSEVTQCNHYLAAELAELPDVTILALGNVAHAAMLKALKLKATAFKFAHAARHELPDGRVLYDSYHCSRYNTQTRRLTEAMFHAVFASIQNEQRS